MSIFKKNKVESNSAGKAELVGTELHVNPPADVSLKRLEARYARVCKSLDSGKWLRESSKVKEMSEIKRRLELQLKLMKGDY